MFQFLRLLEKRKPDSIQTWVYLETSKAAHHRYKHTLPLLAYRRMGKLLRIPYGIHWLIGP
jgi:hypothetical protein